MDFSYAEQQVNIFNHGKDMVRALLHASKFGHARSVLDIIEDKINESGLNEGLASDACQVQAQRYRHEKLLNILSLIEAREDQEIFEADSNEPGDVFSFLGRVDARDHRDQMESTFFDVYSDR